MFSKILPGGAAEQAGKLTEGRQRQGRDNLGLSHPGPGARGLLEAHLLLPSGPLGHSRT